MNIILIDGKQFKSSNQLHKYLKQKMLFPDYYGENLDALWDMLCETTEPTKIMIENKSCFIDNLGSDAMDFIYLFNDAQHENEFIEFFMKE